MNGLTFHMKSSERYERREEVNVLCIVDRIHERSVVALDHIRNF